MNPRTDTSVVVARTMSRLEAATFLNVSDGGVTQLVAAGCLTYLPGTYSLLASDVEAIDAAWPAKEGGRRNLPTGRTNAAPNIRTNVHISNPDTYTAIIRRGGTRHSRTFRTLHAAELWRDTFLAQEAAAPKPVAPTGQPSGIFRRLLARMTKTEVAA